MKKPFFFLLLSFLILAFLGCDNNKIQPGFSTNKTSMSQAVPEHLARVESLKITHMYEAAGTIRPLTESIIESQASAKVIEVFCVPGALVKKGQLLIQLDSRRLETRFKQAKEGLSIAKKQLVQTDKLINEAKANLDQAQLTYNRTKKLFDSAIVSSHNLEQDKSDFLQANARFENAEQAKQAANAVVRQAKEFVKEAQIALGYAKITSPANGVVAKKMIDPGDLAVPGKPLLIIQTSGALRLEANVREGLINRVSKGQEYLVRIETINKTIPSQIQEIHPYADPATRTFLVKASLPDTPGLYPGMFGRLLIPVEQEKTLLIPKKAVTRIGQLELVKIKNQDHWQLVYIKTGKVFDEKIEVLSGLLENETIGY